MQNLRGLGQLGSDAVAGDQGHFMGHGKRLSVSPRDRRRRPGGGRASVDSCEDRTRSVILVSAGTHNLTASRGAVKPRRILEAGPTAGAPP